MPKAALQRIHFAFDQAVIRPADARTLDASAAWLKANPNQLVLIERHCDERGTKERSPTVRATSAGGLPGFGPRSVGRRRPPWPGR